MKRIGLLFVPLLVVLNSCLSTLETAKVRRGFHFGGGVEAIYIGSRYKPSDSNTSDYINYALTLRPSYGWLRGNFGAEIGLKLGTIVQSYVYAEATQNPKTGKYDLKYYPVKGLPSLFPKVSFKLGFFQAHSFNLALLGETIVYAPSAFGVLLSWEQRKYTPYFSLKTFRRFLNAVDRIQGEKEWGMIFVLGGETRLNKGSLLVEGGIIRDYWLRDKFSGILGLGFRF